MEAENFEKLSAALFNCYVPYKEGSMKFKHFVCMYATLTCPESEDETFNLVFRIYCKNPPQFDEET